MSCEVCPYNEAHRLHTYTSYRTHLVSCKDQTFAGVVRVRCPFDYGHIFTAKDRLDWHLPRCESHPKRKEELRKLSDVVFGQTPGKLEYQYCPYYPYHGIRICPEDASETNRLFSLHLETCPRRSKPFRKEVINPQDALPLVPFKPTQLTTLPNPAVDQDLEERTAKERVTVYFREKGFAVRRVLEQGQVAEERTLFIDGVVGCQSAQFPGLGVGALQDRGKYLVARLLPDPLDKTSSQAFYGLYGGLESHQANKMAIIYQLAGLKDIVYLLVHPSEPSGFGGVLNKGELGLFKLHHSELLGVPGVLDQATRRSDSLAYKNAQLASQIAEKDQLISCLQQEQCSYQTSSMQRELEWKEELDRQRELKVRHQAESTELRTTVGAALEDLRRRTEADLALQAFRHDKEIKALSTELERTKREKDICVLNKDQLDQIAESVKRTETSIQAQLKACEAHKAELQKRYETLLAAPKKQTVKRGPLMCRNCGEYQLNTVFWPCGHMYYCNICLNTLKLPLGGSLKHLPSEDRLCPTCGEASTRVVAAFP